MTTAKKGMKGHPPSLLIAPANPERVKYEKMWQFDEYRTFSPGEQSASRFIEVVRPLRGATAIDFGCGTGRGGLMLAMLGGLKVTLVDFANNCLDADVAKALLTQPEYLQFVQADLERPLKVRAHYGYCTDVMEHIPTDKVQQVLRNILQAAQHVFFQICLVEDGCGKMIGEPLHLTVKSHEWWSQQLGEAGAVIHWSQPAEKNDYAFFYATSWVDGKTFVDKTAGGLNVTDGEAAANVRSALKRGLQLCSPHDRRDIAVMVAAGGPSMKDFEDEIIQRRKGGELLITINGAYNWAVERGINPSATILCDAREFNKRFVLPVVPKCRYLLASQCHPATFDSAPPEQTWMWNAAMTPKAYNLFEEEYQGKPWWPIPGGSTVMLRAIPLLRMLGYPKMEIFGFDSCVREDVHHSYPQPENDAERLMIVTCGNRLFKCTDWMLSQAQEFMEMCRFLGDEIQLLVRGDGLISHIINTGAELEDAESLE